MRRLQIRIGPLVALLLAGGACGSPQDGGAAASPPAADPPAPTGEWRTVFERGMDERSFRPERFAVRSDSVRVITTMAEAITPYSPGTVITNLLADSVSQPVASISALQQRPDTITADTVVVAVTPGTLYFYVAQHTGLRDWTVTLQEFHASDGRR